MSTVLGGCGGGASDPGGPDASAATDAADPTADAPSGLDGGPPPSMRVTVAPSRWHTCALDTLGEVKCWGDANSYGTLGLEDNRDRGDQPGEMGAALPTVQLGTGNTAIQIASGGFRSCALLADHTIKCWGQNDAGQLGLGHVQYRGDRPLTMGDNLERVDLGPGRTATSIAMGSDHTCAILDTAAVKCWGGNFHGQLGLGDRVARGSSPTQMGANLPTVPLGTGRTARALSAGQGFTCALLDNNSVRCWGRNEWAQLGVGGVDHRGDQPLEMGDALPILDLGVGRTALALASYSAHSCVVLDTGAVKCWGDNVVGELGTGASGRRGDTAAEMGDNWPSVPLGTGRTARAVAVGENHSCALLDTNQVKCWGYNAYGNLGLENTAYRSSVSDLGDALPAIDFGAGRSVVSLAAGAHHSCVVLDNNAVKCWGQGGRDGTAGGWLGLGDITHRGDASGEMGDLLPAVMLW